MMHSEQESKRTNIPNEETSDRKECWKREVTLSSSPGGALDDVVILPPLSDEVFADFHRIVGGTARSHDFVDSFMDCTTLETNMRLLRQNVNEFVYEIRADSALALQFSELKSRLASGKVGDKISENIPIPGLSSKSLRTEALSSNPPITNRFSTINTTKEKPPFITDVSIGVVGGGIGLLATLSSGGVIGLAPQASGSLLVTASAAFGKGFWVAFGTASLVGAGVAAVIFTCQFLYNNHLQKIQKQLEKSANSTNAETKSLGDKIAKLQSDLKTATLEDSQKVLSEIDALIQELNSKIKKEKDRANYANKQNQSNQSHGKKCLLRASPIYARS